MPIRFAGVVGTDLIKRKPLEKMRRQGFDGVEVFLWRLSREQREKAADSVIHLTKELGLAVSDVGGGPSLVDLGLPEESERALALGEEFLNVAHSVGAKVSLVPSFRAPPGAEREKVLTRAGESLKKLDKAARNLGVYLTIEPLNRYETNLLASMAGTVEYIDALGTEMVRLMADLYHMSIEEASTPAALRTASKHLVHMHVSESHGGYPGTGTVNYGEVFRVLKEVKYDGFMSIEWHKAVGDQVEAYGKALPYLKALYAVI
ncbi:MAG: sugar phosphate isomerase/epimerase family protein [Candidatus Bathyarchaeia archaeon]